MSSDQTLLAKFINWLTRLLSTRVESTDDLIQRRFAEAEREVREQPTRANQPVAIVEDQVARAAQELALRHMQQDFQDRRSEDSRALALNRAQEVRVFGFLIICAAVALLFIIVGGYLIFQGSIKVAVLAEFLGVIVGSGTLILRQLQDRLKDKAASIERQQENQTKYLQAIQTALALSGPEREKQLAETAKWLRETRT